MDFNPGWYETFRLTKDANDTLCLYQNGAVVARDTRPLLPNRYYLHRVEGDDRLGPQ
jgi:hypothetical protein